LEDDSVRSGPLGESAACGFCGVDHADTGQQTQPADRIAGRPSELHSRSGPHFGKDSACSKKADRFNFVRTGGRTCRVPVAKDCLHLGEPLVRRASGGFQTAGSHKSCTAKPSVDASVRRCSEQSPALAGERGTCLARSPTHPMERQASYRIRLSRFTTS